MIKVPNYNVVVPVTPDLVLYTNPRTTAEGDRKHLVHEVEVTDAVLIDLPWIPIAQNWVEIYQDGIRIVNPRIESATGGDLFEIFNVRNNVVIFNKPVTGSLKIICDTTSSHYWGSLIISTDNVQGSYVYADANYVVIENWNITAGTANGTTYNVFFKPGPEYQPGSYVIIENCEPTIFNGNFQINRSTRESVSFTGKVPTKDTIKIPGLISGFGNVTYKQIKGISLYSEPIIITQPVHGYARLTTDRQAIAYIPDVNYTGNDTFSWSMINQHGQIGTPKCVQIIIRALPVTK